ncbi:MAG: phosphate acyltransferase PlsX [Candidatus Omnitrophota bacterium]|nr:phosphate acyltransferase PlsX [Candidatus Omnitrophota bacterium]
MKIVLDAMGGDNAPQVTVEGAVEAARDFNFDIVLVGDRDIISAELKKHKTPAGKIIIVHASQVIGMAESALTAVRKKKDSSISVAVRILKEKKADGLVTAGNTGSAVAATTLNLGLLPGVKRPGIAIVLPTLKGMALLIDVGANIDPKPEHLLQYAIMGTVYSRYILKKANPKIGLLNIGEEASKGTELLKETYKMLDRSNLNFIGNIEGRDIFTGRSDCIVCDGFIGNVVLKVCESIAETMVAFFKREVGRSLLTKLGAGLCKPAFSALKKEVDYSECGGAPLLGVDGTCIIAHGGSNAKAIKNAIKVAGGFVDYRVNQHVVKEIKTFFGGGNDAG